MPHPTYRKLKHVVFRVGGFVPQSGSGAAHSYELSVLVRVGDLTEGIQPSCCIYCCRAAVARSWRREVR
jgi:hypothetical protein